MRKQQSTQGWGRKAPRPIDSSLPREPPNALQTSPLLICLSHTHTASPSSIPGPLNPSCPRSKRPLQPYFVSRLFKQKACFAEQSKTDHAFMIFY